MTRPMPLGEFALSCLLCLLVAGTVIWWAR